LLVVFPRLVAALPQALSTRAACAVQPAMTCRYQRPA
jgi:hypothetical protein